MAIPKMKLLQSGGFADVFLDEESNTCYKIFHRPGAEVREFQVAKYMIDNLVERNDSNGKQRSVVQYYDYGYSPKNEILKIYERNCTEDKTKLNMMIENFKKEEFIPYICMEFINGMDALDYGVKYGYFSERTAIDIMISLLYALQEFHDMNLIHRDLKPDNFMIYHDENNSLRVKLIDLGLATIKPLDDSQAIYEQHIGTARYMAPEAIKGWHSASSDLYSIGFSMYILCGCPKDLNSKFMKLLLKLTDINPRNRGSVKESLKILHELQPTTVTSVATTSSSSASSGKTSPITPLSIDPLDDHKEHSHVQAMSSPSYRSSSNSNGFETYSMTIISETHDSIKRKFNANEGVDDSRYHSNGTDHEHSSDEDNDNDNDHYDDNISVAELKGVVKPLIKRKRNILSLFGSSR